MTCVFCNIAENKAKAWKFYEDAECIAILDAFPVTEGHTLVIPRKHLKDINQLSDGELAHLFNIARKLAALLQKSLGARAVNIATAPAAIDHFHLHVIPRYDHDMMGPLADLDNKRELNEETMKEVFGHIMTTLESKPEKTK